MLLCDNELEYCLLQTENTLQQSVEESVEVSTHKVFTIPITNSITEALNHILRVMYFYCNFHKIFFTYLKIKF